MTKKNPEERASIEDIKKSDWYNGEVYTDYQLNEKVGNIYYQCDE